MTFSTNILPSIDQVFLINFQFQVSKIKFRYQNRQLKYFRITRAQFLNENFNFYSVQDQDLALQNQRLQLDLDKTIGERRLLSRQMENWKRQLTLEDPGNVEDEDEYETEEVLKLKQEQAYRSVGALQLRVEELTLEVTKVIFILFFLSKIVRQNEGKSA